MCRMLGRSLIGNNSTTTQRWYCWYGKTAGNGKSTVSSLLASSLGDYYQVGHTTMLTQASARSDAANADIFKLVGTRIVALSETEEKAVINSATLKTHSGEKSICYRGLFDRDIKTTNITWTIFLLTNEKQKLDAGDAGVLRRTAYVPFRAKFVDTDAEILTDLPDGQKYYLKDSNTVNEIMRECQLEFLHLMLRNCDPDDKLELTGDIARETDALIRSADTLNDMLTETFERSPDKEEGVSWSDMKDILKRRHGLRYDEVLKKAGTVGQLLERIAQRLPYTKLEGTAQGNAMRYKNWDGQMCRARRVFKGIREISDYLDSEDTGCKLD